MSWLSSSLPLNSSAVHSNLERFLHSVTPILPSKSLPQRCTNDLNNSSNPSGKAANEYFTLRDLWGQYYEWSAYGVGAPLVLSNGESVVQYYVPYLSGIQLFIKKSPVPVRNMREDNDVVEFEVESSSDDSESDKFSRSTSNNSCKTWDVASGDSSIDHEGSAQMKDFRGDLYFQFYDKCPPYWRIPLVEKIIECAQNYQGLMTLKSVDLSPASWMSVAWYPIYHIPTKGSIKDLSACFLTFHTLSSAFQDMLGGDNKDTKRSIPGPQVAAGVVLGGKSGAKGNARIALHPFGLATYRMHGDMWINPVQADVERLSNLQSAASSWLKQLNVEHPDFHFFTSH